MKPTTISTISHILSDRLHGMIAQLSKAPAANVPGLAAGIDETSSALTDFARHQHETNAAEVNAGLLAVGILTDNVKELEELDRFFEGGTGKGGRAHKMVKGLLNVARHQAPETLTQPV